MFDCFEQTIVASLLAGQNQGGAGVVPLRMVIFGCGAEKETEVVRRLSDPESCQVLSILSMTLNISLFSSSSCSKHCYSLLSVQTFSLSLSQGPFCHSCSICIMVFVHAALVDLIDLPALSPASETYSE